MIPVLQVTFLQYAERGLLPTFSAEEGQILIQAENPTPTVG